MRLRENGSFRNCRRLAGVLAGLVACTALGGYGQRGGAPLPAEAKQFLGNEQAIAEARNIFNQRCTACHGRDGVGADIGPALAAPGQRYGRRSPAEIFDAVKNGIRGTTMPPGGLPDADCWRLTAYVLALRGTAIDAPADGDVAHGEQIFWGKGECGKCHMAGGKGGLLGPDLSRIANLRKLVSIREALTKENYWVAYDGGSHASAIAPVSGYQVVRVVTRNGREIRGVLKNEDSFSLQMLSMDGALHLFSRDDLREIVYEPGSLMPSDYADRLTAKEMQDLLAFLSRLGSATPTEQVGRRGGGGE
jgi:putative heme-binding domain-containing protein